MSIGLLALLDDVAAMVKASAASLDDIAVQVAKTGSKVSGVVIDDAAVTPKYVVGLDPKRELAIIYRMRAIHDNRVPLLGHDGQGAHIHHQRVIAEARPAFGEHDVAVTGFSNFIRNVFHVPWRKELAFFHIHHTPGVRRRNQQIRLATQKRGDLQNIHHGCHRCAMRNLMHVRQGGDAKGLSHLIEHGERCIKPHAALAFQASAVCFIVAGFIDKTDTACLADFRQPTSNLDRVVARFHLARPGDQRERQIIAEGDVASGNMVRFGHTYSIKVSVLARRLRPKLPSLIAGLGCKSFKQRHRFGNHPSKCQARHCA